MSKKPRPGRLRIVAGKWRSRLLDIADVPGLRPTSERIRETLFNWLAPSLPGARCLDLFAGTGALGLEALSRGASKVVFVEKSAQAAKALEINANLLDAIDADIRRGDAIDFLEKTKGESFDIIFLDPPFADDLLDDLCRLLDGGPLLADGALVYLEEDRAKPEVELPPGWVRLKSKSAGNVRYSLAQPGGEA
jgi:16S rRNA (guanine966-N2)-methyltransferase